jgi:RNA polymerase sigma factor (sigma-70 family)
MGEEAGMNTLERQLRRSHETSLGVTDGELLSRFVSCRDEAAFELLVHRHGAMVFGVCGKLLRDVHEAEDALQATFLTLACRAGTVRRQSSLGSWLYQVAYRICLRARRGWKPVTGLSDLAGTSEPPLMEQREEAELLAEELAQLSERLRTVVVLCYLQGKSSSEAAAELGCPVNTVATRLYRAREELRRGLQRRGVTLVGSIATALTPGVISALNLPAVAHTLAQRASQLVSGVSLHTLAAPAVVRMMEGTQNMTLWKAVLVSTFLLLAGAAVGLPLLSHVGAQDVAQAPAIQPPTPPPPLTIFPPQLDKKADEVQEIKRFDLDQDGADDLILECTRSSGPLSTYFSHLRLRAVHGVKLLHGGAPLTSGTLLTVADVITGVDVAQLANIGGSLRFPERGGAEFNSGPWFGRTAPLGLAKVKDGDLYLGHVQLTVSENGEVTLDKARLELVAADAIEVNAEPQDNDVADVKSKDLKAGGDPNMRYFLIESKAKAPADGYGLVIVLPGGDGGAGFHTFVKRMFKNGLPEGQYLLVQPVAKKWTNNQQITWPTEKNRVPGMKFTTEEFITAVIDDVAGKHKVNPQRVFTLSWSSGGPAAYAASLNAPKVTGSFIAMSVFNPRFLPELQKAKGHAYFLYHSEADMTCPFRMAKQAEAELPKHGAKVQLKTYEGGHGWRGPVYEDIREGITWLEQTAGK